MVPGGVTAGAILLSLLPGWWFLRRTESCRRPRELSGLQEVLELVGVGILTTGLAVVLGLLIRPELVLDHGWPPDTANEIRLDLVLVCGALVAAVLFAEIFAQVVRRRASVPESTLNVGVWWSTLRPEEIPEGSLAYVSLALDDGSTAEGVLDTYTWAPDVAHRDIALRKPIKFTHPGQQRWRRSSKSVVRKPTYDRLVVPETEIKHIAVQYVER